MKKIEVNSDKCPAAIGPYSHAIRYNNLVVTSGQLPLNQEGELAGEDAGDQARQCLENVKAILKKAGGDMKNVIKCTIFITDMNDFAKVNEVYQGYFEKPYPARSCIEVSKLPKGVKVEIEAIAVIE